MTSPLVATKVYPPRPRSGIVERTRLTSRMHTAAQAKLTLVSAPAGFGKTTAVTAWLASAQPDDSAVAWVSLDEGDGQTASFWTYVIGGLQRAVPDVGASLLPQLQAGQPPSRPLLALLVNEIADLAVDVDLVLDDYHLADTPEVADGMAYLLDHLPPNLHVVISTRADPALPLARLRARGELVELRAQDLRFTEAETAAYLSDVGGLSMQPSDVTTLSERTEGWAAALQLAALSMQGRDDLASFVASFAGDDRYVVDYLADEVLSRQSQEVREFLLRTSVLDRLTGDLCDSVTGTTGGRAMLESLDRANMFLIPLDDRRQWYRYHHLFADVLRSHLDSEGQVVVARLHRRASDWYAAAEEPAAAVRHALAAGDTDRAADLVEEAVPALGRARAEATLRAWVDDFPDDVVRRRPVLALGLVGGLMQHNEFGPAESMLGAVERWLPAIRTRLARPADPEDVAGTDLPSAADLVFLDQAALARVPAGVEMYRAALSLIHGDPEATVRHAQRTLAEAAPDDHLARGAAAALSGLALWSRGDLEQAHEWYSRSVVNLLEAGHVADVLGCTITLADLRIAQGRLADASAAYDRALHLATAGEAPLRGTADVHTGVAEIAVERGDLDAAHAHLNRSEELGEGLALGQNPYRLKAASAALALSEGDLSTARELFVEAQRVYLGDFSPEVRPLHARMARVDAALDDVRSTLAWVTEQEFSPDADVSYLNEFTLVTLAEVLLAQHRNAGDDAALRDCRALLDRLLPHSVDGGRRANEMDILVLQALAARAAHDPGSVLPPLRRALEVGTAEGHVYVFARHGVRTVELLDTLAAVDGTSPHLDRLRAAAVRAGTPPGPDARRASPTTATTGKREHMPGLVEPLSPRELDVLRLLASEMDGPDIARHMVVSVNTLRTHTKNIYAKLGVNSRRAALRRAHELGLPLQG